MTIKFTVKHTINTSASTFWSDIHNNEEFLRALYVDCLGFGYEALEFDVERGTRRLRVEPKMDAPKPVVKLLGDGLTAMEIGTFRDDPPSYEFRVEPAKMADKIRMNGRMWAEELDDDRCTRCIEFQAEAKILGVGRIFEAFLEKSTRESYDRGAAFTNEYLARR